MNESAVKFATARTVNDETLLADSARIRSGQALATLEPFAKAYLGLYRDIDSALAPKQKIALLANEKLAQAIFQGMIAALQSKDIPSPHAIGLRQADDGIYASGYVVLAGLDLIMADKPKAMAQLPQAALKAALCFHYANVAYLAPIWLDDLLRQQPQLAQAALNDYWLGLLAGGTDRLPGFYHMLHNKKLGNHLAQLVLSILPACQQVKIGLLNDLLLLVLDQVDSETLLPVLRQQLSQTQQLSLRANVLWLAAAYLAAPEEFYPILFAYIGQSREKALRLLDFSVAYLDLHAVPESRLSASATARLLRIIAPLFPLRHIDQVDNDDISRKVMTLFHAFAQHRGVAANEAMHWLRSIRVMHRCDAILDRIEQQQTL